MVIGFSSIDKSNTTKLALELNHQLVALQQQAKCKALCN
jgi:hypothetical protein